MKLHRDKEGRKIKRKTMAYKKGTSVEDAIPVNSVHEEYDYLDEKYGRRKTDWRLVGQYLNDSGGKHYDKLEIRLADGEVKEVYFDISAFHPKSKLDEEIEKILSGM